MSKGVLIFKGMKVGVLPGDLQISVSDDGDKESKLILSTSYNVVPVWMKIAYDALKQSKLASEGIAERWDDNEENQRQLLIDELTPSMQVFSACGIGIDAIYDTIRPYSNITQQDIEAWKRNKTSRSKQIIEVIRRVYKLNGDTLRDFKSCLSKIFEYRDKAVHPSLELKNAEARPDIPVGVDWKFSVYRYSNARWCLTNSINMIAYLYEHKSGIKEVDESLVNIVDALEELGVVQIRA